ncbi:MAG: hypothetical protein GY785_25050 [Gammaproteobacteria bacterium]|nr:hypothetical protein [Gammaproteobacteria bacterium]
MTLEITNNEGDAVITDFSSLLTFEKLSPDTDGTTIREDISDLLFVVQDFSPVGSFYRTDSGDPFEPAYPFSIDEPGSYALELLPDTQLLASAGTARQSEVHGRGRWLVWQDQRSGNWNIWARNLDDASSPFAITTTATDDETNPVVEWPWVVYQRKSVSDPRRRGSFTRRIC